MQPTSLRLAASLIADRHRAAVTDRRAELARGGSAGAPAAARVWSQVAGRFGRLSPFVDRRPARRLAR